MIEMERKRKICPLLQDPCHYVPDTIDLANDLTERQYWLPCLQKMVEKFIEKAGALNPNYPDATEVAMRCYRTFTDLIQQLATNPDILQPLSIRTLLDFHEQTLRTNNFEDAWRTQKESETQLALREFAQRIAYVDTLSDRKCKWLELANGVLAGNIFDWGAKAVTDILECSANFGLTQAMQLIEARPWFRDNFDSWLMRIEQTPYQMAVIFVDNAGVDFVLGILPFARELLKQNTKVILSANSSPALNDITHRELSDCLQCAKLCCPVIRRSLDDAQLTTIENGQKGPCLDLRNLDNELCETMKNADLIVLEGMGRAIHTNLNAKFNVDSLKMAVLKNEWLAHRLGATQFSVVFEFVPTNSNK